jgi:predicted ATPase
MIRSLQLTNFKNFRHASLTLGNFTVLVGANASGKSNVQDALRFLHGVARGYTLAEIIVEKWIEGGVLQWSGVRGGVREIAYRSAKTFGLETVLQTDAGNCVHRLEVELAGRNRLPLVVAESLALGRRLVFEAGVAQGAPAAKRELLDVHVAPANGRPAAPYRRDRPVLSQLAESNTQGHRKAQALARKVIDQLGSMRFLDLSAEAMRAPSAPGQAVLGSRGENLSSVLQSICANPRSKHILLQWVNQLAPVGATDFEFETDPTGKVLVRLVESGGQRTSAQSASEGTLRFLAVLAALLGPAPARFYFFEDLESAIHPTRLYLLLEFIEQRVAKAGIQVVATSHSPQLLGYLSPESLKSAALVYRLPGDIDGHIRPIAEFPGAAQLLSQEDPGRLLATGWLENASVFLEGTGAGK